MLKSIYLILEKPDEHKYGKIANLFIFGLIIVSTISLYLSTVNSLQQFQIVFESIEVVVMIIFTIELFFRFFSIGIDSRYCGIKGKINYIKKPFIFIDILVLIPFYVSFFGIDFVFLRVLRLIRLFKLFRHTRYEQFDDTIFQIIKENKSKFVVVLYISTILVLITAPIMYYLEYNSQPEVFSSIPAALWWTTVTFTTVGYGDMYPVTSLGKVLATVVSVFGIAFYAIPGSIFTSALLDKIKQEREQKNDKTKTD